MRAMDALRSASSSLDHCCAFNRFLQELAQRCAPGVAALRLVAAQLPSA